jgi:hypothetical protein
MLALARSICIKLGVLPTEERLADVEALLRAHRRGAGTGSMAHLDTLDRFGIEREPPPAEQPRKAAAE